MISGTQPCLGTSLVYSENRFCRQKQQTMCSFCSIRQVGASTAPGGSMVGGWGRGMGGIRYTRAYLTGSGSFKNSWCQDFPGGAVVKNPPANAGDTGSSPGPGRSHMPRSN